MRRSVQASPPVPRRELSRQPRSDYGVGAALRYLAARDLDEKGLLEGGVPILTKADVERVWSSSCLRGRSDICIRNRVLIGLMLDTGIRRAEVASLTPSSLSLDDYLLTVVGKGNKQRRVPFSHCVKLLLEIWIARPGTGDDRLFWLTGAGSRTTLRCIEPATGILAFYPP